MSKKQSEQNIQSKKLKFSFDAPQAKEVFLVGDFNQWNYEKHKMEKKEIGSWEAKLKLTPGTYQYKFVVDGRWQEDPQNDQKCLNSFGTYNNLLTVTE